MALDVGELVAHLRVGAEGMARGLRDGESRFRKFGDKLTGLAAGAGLAAATAFGAAIFANMAQDDIGAKIAAQMGGSAEDAKMYGKLAGKLYAENWGESVQAIGETIKEVASARILPDGTPEELEDISRRAQTLADVFDLDVHGSVVAVKQLITAGLVPDAQTGFDLIAKAVQNGDNSADDLLDTLNEYPTQFRDLGISGEQALGLIHQGLQAGARDSDIVADALKELNIRVKDKSAADGLKVLGINADQAAQAFATGGPKAAAALGQILDKLRAVKDPADRFALSQQLLGTQSEDLSKALFNLDLKTAAEQMDGAAGAVQRAGDAIGQTDNAKIEAFKRSAMGAAQALAADLVPSLSTMGGWIQKNQAWIKPLAITLGGLAAAIVVVNLATKAWMATEAAFTTVKAIATSANWLFSASLWATLGPILLIVAGIALLVAAIYLIATRTTWFQDAWKWAWGGIKAAAAAVWGWLRDSFWPWLKNAYQWIADGVIAMKNRFIGGWQAVWDFLVRLKNGVAGIFSAIGNFIASGFEYGMNIAKSRVNAIIGFVNGAIGGLNRLISAANVIPGVHLGQIGQIPKLAGGGAVMPNGRRGTPVIMGDGGEVEYGVPKSDMRAIIAEAVAAGRGPGGAGAATVIVRADSNEFFRWLRFEINAKGGNVQKVLAGA